MGATPTRPCGAPLSRGPCRGPMREGASLWLPEGTATHEASTPTIPEARARRNEIALARRQPVLREIWEWSGLPSSTVPHVICLSCLPCLPCLPPSPPPPLRPPQPPAPLFARGESSFPRDERMKRRRMRRRRTDG
eukprot:7525802-Pyramimonas_sp.AAC.1